MSAVVTSLIRRVTMAAYLAYLTTDKAEQQGVRVAGWRSDFGGVAETRAGIDALLSGTSRKNAGVSVVVSYALDELAPTPENVQRALDAAYDMLRSGAPNQPIVLVAQLDGAGGKLHVHGIVVNHDVETGLAGRGARTHWQWRQVNDAWNRAHAHEGFQVLEAGTALESAAVRIARSKGVATPDLDALGVTPFAEMKRGEATAWVAAQLDELIEDGSLDALPALGVPAALTVPLDGELSLSVRVKPPGKAGVPTLTVAVVDGNEDVVMGAPGKGGKRAPMSRTQGQLDKLLTPAADERRYSYEAVIARITGGLPVGFGVEKEEEDEQRRERQGREDRGGESESARPASAAAGSDRGDTDAAGHAPGGGTSRGSGGLPRSDYAGTDRTEGAELRGGDGENQREGTGTPATNGTATGGDPAGRGVGGDPGEASGGSDGSDAAAGATAFSGVSPEIARIAERGRVVRDELTRSQRLAYKVDGVLPERFNYLVDDAPADDTPSPAPALAPPDPS